MDLRTRVLNQRGYNTLTSYTTEAEVYNLVYYNCFYSYVQCSISSTSIPTIYNEEAIGKYLFYVVLSDQAAESYLVTHEKRNLEHVEKLPPEISTGLTRNLFLCYVPYSVHV